MGLIGNSFRLISCMSSISRHVLVTVLCPYAIYPHAGYWNKGNKGENEILSQCTNHQLETLMLHPMVTLVTMVTIFNSIVLG